MSQKTKNYSQFIFREDNRKAHDTPHLERIIHSIKTKNLLHLRPITVNDKMEIIDGQHRLLAAKALGVDIYYDVSKDFTPFDMALMNINKAWTNVDFLNYYVKNKYVEYVKLENFLKKNQIPLPLAVQIITGRNKSLLEDFKQGKMVFNADDCEEALDVCRDTISTIKKNTPGSNWTGSSKFALALIQLCRKPGFNKEQWFKNLKAMIKTCKPQITLNNYYEMLSKIYDNPILNQQEIEEYEPKDSFFRI